MINKRLGVDVGVDIIIVPELADPCVFNGVNNEGKKYTFGDFVQLEIVPQQFVEVPGAGADNGSGFIRYDQLDGGPCGRRELLAVLRFVGSVRG